MDVKKICWGLCLLACFGGFAGCSDDEDFSNENVIIREDFSSTEGEVIEFELKDAPAYVIGEDRGYVSICFADYAYEYFNNIDAFYQLAGDDWTHDEMDIIDMRIGVAVEDYKTYNIPYKSTVYVSAQVTNLGRVLNEGDDWGFITTPIQRKAYLVDLKLRNH